MQLVKQIRHVFLAETKVPVQDTRQRLKQGRRPQRLVAAHSYAFSSENMLSKLQMATRLMPFCQERDGCMSAVAATPAMDRTMPASSNMSWVIIMLASMAYTMAMRRRLRFSGAVRMRRAMAEVRPLPLPRHPTWGENSARIFGRYSGRKFTGSNYSLY